MSMTVVFDLQEPAGHPTREAGPARGNEADRLSTMRRAGRRHEVVPCSVWFGPALGGHQASELLAFLGSHNGVAVLQWPRDEGQIPVLSRLGLPRLLLVHLSARPVPPDSPLQRSHPSSAAPDEIHASLLWLCRQAGKRRTAGGPPLLSDDGWVRTGAGKVELPPDAHRLARPLFARFGRPVDDAVLFSCEGPNCTGPLALDGRVARLRRHVNPLGLDVVGVPGGSHVVRWCAP